MELGMVVDEHFEGGHYIIELMDVRKTHKFLTA